LEYHSGTNFLLNAANTATFQQEASLILLMCVLLFLSFSIAGSEVAFFSLSYKDIQHLKTKHSKALKRIVHLLDDPKMLLTSMLIANSFINI
jgi:Mg2+/Co2+ transporter CorB